MTTRRTRLLQAGALLLGCALAALLLVPALFQGPVTRRVRAELDRRLDARVTWDGARLGVLRDFPDVTLALQGLAVVGEEPFAGDTLLSASRLDVVLDLGSVVRAVRGRGPVVVRAVALERPDLRLRVSEDGRASWDVMADAPDAGRPDPPAGGARNLEVELQGFHVDGGAVLFESVPSGVRASLQGLDHTLRGRFSGDSLVATTRTRADRATVTLGGTPWLSEVALDFAAELAVDPDAGRVTFRENALRLNDLLLRFSGAVARSDDGLALDLAFDTPESDFGQLLSLVPPLRQRDFASLETSGTFSVEGEVAGPWGGGAFPAFSLRAGVADGSFRYPDLPLPARAIAADLAVENPGGGLDATVVRLSRIHAEIGGEPLDGSLTLRTPLSDPDFEGRVAGTLDLADLARTVKLERGEALAGTLTADATVRARRSAVEARRYDEIEARGTVSGRDLTFALPEPRGSVSVEEAALELSPRRADLRSFRARFGESDIQASGRLDNLLGFALRDEVLTGAGTFTSRQVVLDELRSGQTELRAIPVPTMLDLTLDGVVERLTLGELEMAEARGRLLVRQGRLTLEGFSMETLGGRIGVDGLYDTTDPERPTFDAHLVMDSLDVAGASAALLTVRTLAPVARYARGTFSANLELSGALDGDLSPVFEALEGGGSLLTSRIAVQDFPLLDRLAQVLEMPRFQDPTFEAIRSTLEIRDGRMHVRPFQVGTGGLRLGVGGSTGVDQTLDYALGFAVARTVLGQGADRVIQGLLEGAGRAGVELGAADSLRLDVRITGTVTDPALDVRLGEAVASVGRNATQAGAAAVERRVEDARARLDSAREETRLRVRAQADSMVAEAESRAETIRAEARRLAEEVRAEGDRGAEELLARATNPLARQAAQPVAARIRREAAARADQLVAEADQRADALVAEARRRADALAGEAGGPGGGAGP